MKIHDELPKFDVVLNFKDNPLLPCNVRWLQALFLFASIGTILTAITIIHSCVNLFSEPSMIEKCVG